MPRLLLALFVCAFLLPPACGAQGFVEHLDPPALQRGKTTRMTAVGSQMAKALDLWSSLPAGKLSATPVGGGKGGNAVFDVRVAADAPVGVFGLRVATPDGLSNVHLCLIDDLPVRPAPDSTKGAARVELPCALWGRFREANVDRFAIAVAAGQQVSFEAVGNRLGKEVDPLLTIRDARGRLVVEHDNDAGLYFDCRFSHRFAAAGTYTVELRDSRFQGHEHGSYVLRMGRFPAARVAVPAAVVPGKNARLSLPEAGEAVEAKVAGGQAAGPVSLPLRRPGDEGSTWVPVQVGDLEATVATADATSAKKGTPAKAPTQLCGVLTGPGERQWFRLELKKGQTIYLTGHGRWHNSSIDLDLALTDEAGHVLRQASQGDDDLARFDFTAPKEGVYCVRVRDQAREGGAACAYRVAVRGHAPEPEVVAEVEGITLPRGSYQAIPLKVTRNGYAGPIALTLSGAPAGVTLTPGEIPVGVDTLVCKLAGSDQAPLGLHTFQIWSHATKAVAARKLLVRTRPLIDRQLLNVDLIPYTLREDQRRLPPSVSDRLALQVTEAAPFTVELAEPTITLPRYQQAGIPLITTRKPGFEAPITFTARGGQLADKEEGRTRVYAEFPQATARALKLSGSVHSRILSNLGKSRIEVLASASHGGRRITLVRTFELEIRTAFRFAVMKEPIKVLPGGTTNVRLTIKRVKRFSGPVRVELSPTGGLEFAEKVTIPRGQESVEVTVKAEAMAGPGRRSIALAGAADVDGFEEESRDGRIEIEIVKAETAKKK